MQVIHNHSAASFLVVVPEPGKGIRESRGHPTVMELMEELPCSFVFYDPAGIGSSWGNTEKDDVEHEDNLQVIVEALPQGAAVGVLSIEGGLSVAMGCEAQLNLLLLADINGQHRPNKQPCMTPRISLCTLPQARHESQGVIVGDTRSFANLIEAQLGAVI